MSDKKIKRRLEYLRGELRAECISQLELSELQGLAEYIEPGDVELLEAAGVPEFPEATSPMKVQIDSVTFIADRLDDDGEREITLTQHGHEILLNADNIKQLSLQIAGRFEEMTCCHVVEPGDRTWAAFVQKHYREAK